MLFRGTWARDLLCVSLPSCVELDFFYMSYQSGMPENIDAIIGFAKPNYNILLAPDKTPTDHQYYLDAISKSSNQNMFSTRYR